MPPNVLYSWDSTASKRHYRDLPIGIDDDFHAELDTELFLPPKISPEQPTPTEDDARTLWKKILRKESNGTASTSTTTTSTKNHELLASLSSIVVLDNEVDQEEWLNRFGGHLSDVSPELLQGLRQHAPALYHMSTVADFNDNLRYHMQQKRGLKHFPGLDPSHVEELEATLQADEYLGSFLTTKSSIPQPAHVDYPWEVLEEHARDQSLKLGFFPLTREGMFLQIWPTASPCQDRSIEIEGQIVFIPYGKLLIVPASTIHGGGFRTTPLGETGGNGNDNRNGNGGCGGNLRFHLYIATNGASLPVHQTNKYTERGDKTKEMSRRYVDSKHMQVLLDSSFFV
mmetsp:Transcript_22377/g.52825  ORF Transcript_22377/g.52825 Transcript_22377/m.52825 type:complete len:342 (-) Transcript_22377:165-1190(-)|eukprot:CAMPEP_0172399784 /NCGR_PEP_ID=MMETSP1061-20121228/42555_1 /TAXON_ID=37318 /ORGANISM="Pseudo-nitzschia pungens, Strain cf. pungens" /LENGTH=341 /DNA_ID=CAMNT_0013132771 /DNA_START=150 /DNA_END=1175 /DNA_ORIENTATION=+